MFQNKRLPSILATLWQLCWHQKPVIRNVFAHCFIRFSTS